MRDLNKNINYKSGYKYVLFLILCIGFLFLLNLALELYNGRLSFIEFVIISLPSFFLFKFYYDAFKRLLYTFWGLSVLVFLFIFYYFITSLLRQTYPFQTLLFLSSIILFSITLYLSSSPLYYQKVSWWEFDYRYRADIEAEISFENKRVQSRLTDVRRRGGSIATFEDFPLGTNLLICFKIDDQEFQLDSVIGSKSKSIVGRPFSYGIKFLVQNKEKKTQYKLLSRLWDSKEEIRLNQKFEKEA